MALNENSNLPEFGKEAQIKDIKTKIFSIISIDKSFLKKLKINNYAEREISTLAKIFHSIDLRHRDLDNIHNEVDSLYNNISTQIAIEKKSPFLDNFIDKINSNDSVDIWHDITEENNPLLTFLKTNLTKTVERIIKQKDKAKLVA